MDDETPAEAPKTLPVFKKSATKYFNWAGYWAGMYVSAVRACTSAFLAFSGTQTAEAFAPVALANVGLSIQQAAAAGLTALVFDIIRYVNLKPLPDVKEETVVPFNS